MFRDREEAGELLAEALEGIIDGEKNPVILAIPRGEFR